MPEVPYTPTTQPVPSQLPVGSSIPPAQGTYQQRVDGWNKFLETLTQPGITNSVLTFGLNALQGPAPGQSEAGKIAQSLGQGLNAYTQGKQRLIDQSAQEQEIARQNALVRDAQSRTAETIRSNKEQEKIARERIASTQSYYDQIAEGAKAKGGLSWDDALNISRQSLQAQMKELSALLQISDPTDPSYKVISDEFVRLQNNYNELLQQRARGYIGESQGIVSRQLSPEAINAIFQQYGDTPETRRRIMEYTGGTASLPEPTTQITPEENAQIDQAMSEVEQGQVPTPPTESTAPQGVSASTRRERRANTLETNRRDIAVDKALKKYRIATPESRRGRREERAAVDNAVAQVRQKIQANELNTLDKHILQLAIEGDLSTDEKEAILRRLEAE